MSPAPGRPAVRWAELTSPAIGAILADDPRHVCLLPVGAVEQHGPHLPAGTDTIIATALAEEVSRRTGALVLPPIAHGASFFHGTALPGTLSATPEELIIRVRQTVTWAAHSGVRRMLLVNGHVGNAAALAVACDHIRFERPDVRVGAVDWWQADPVVSAEVTADAADWHANCAETSVMLALRPGLVDEAARLQADDEDRSAGLVFRYTAPALSRNGVTGRPSLATAGSGRVMVGRVVEALVATVRRARDEEAPL